MTRHGILTHTDENDYGVRIPVVWLDHPDERGWWCDGDPTYTQGGEPCAEPDHAETLDVDAWVHGAVAEDDREHPDE